MRLLAMLILALCFVAPAVGQLPSTENSLEANFPPVPPLAFYEEVLKFRAEVEREVALAQPKAADGSVVSELIDTLVQKWDTYGEYMDREHGDFPNMSRGRPYWLITTDEAADTLVDRVGPVIEAYIEAHPEEKVGQIRAEWELAVQKIGVPNNRVFGFQIVELARRGREVRERLEGDYPSQLAEVHDAYLRFLWDLIQFYRQLHATWYDRHSSNVAKEDWIVYRMASNCEDPNWNLLLSFTAIGVDTSNTDPMNDKFMHRLVLVDPACPETVDFVVPLRHYRLMEKELNERSDEERQRIYEQYKQEAIRRAERERQGGGER